MVGSLMSAVIIIIGAFFWNLIGNQISQIEVENQQIRDGINLVNLQKADYLKTQKRLDAARSRIEDNDIKLVRLMEKEMKRQKIGIPSFKPSETFLTNNRNRLQRRSDEEESEETILDLLAESQTVTLRRLSLRDLTNLMAALEDRKEPVKTTGLEISPLNSDRQQLREVVLKVTTYRFKASESL